MVSFREGTSGYGERRSFRRTVIFMDQGNVQMSSVDLIKRWVSASGAQMHPLLQS